MKKSKESISKSTKYVPQLNYDAKQRARGLVKVGAWVPRDRRDALLDVAEKWRREAGFH